MAAAEVTLRAATRADADAMADVDRQSWPQQLATTQDEFAARIAAYPDGQLVAVTAGRIVGTASAQRITAEHLAQTGHSYDAVTDHNRFTHSHDANGEIYQLIGVGVLPSARGQQLGRRLVDRQIELARNLPGIERIVGFTRPAHFHKHTEMSIDEYVRASTADGSPLDPVLAFHLDAGAQVVSIHSNFRPQDRSARGYGVLIEYTMRSSEHL